MKHAVSVVGLGLGGFDGVPLEGSLLGWRFEAGVSSLLEADYALLFT